MLRTLACLLTAVASALTLAACGGSEDTSSADFRSAYAPISAAIRGLGSEVGSSVTTAKGKSDIELQAAFGDLAESATAVADDLAAAKAPDDAQIETARAALVTGLRKAAADLDAISAAATSGDAAAAKAATIRLAADSAGIREPRRKLDDLVLKSN